MSYASPNLQEIARERYGVAGRVLHAASGGNDTTGDGLSWDTAYATPVKAAAVATARDLILVGGGTIAIGNAVVNLPDDVSMIGMGKDATTLTSTADLDTLGCIVRPGNRSRVAGMTIQGIASAGTFQAPLGFDAGAATPQAVTSNWHGADLVLVGDSDGLYCNPNTSTAPAKVRGELRRCDIRTSYDAVALYNGDGNAWPTWDCVVDLHDCSITVDGMTTTGTGSSSRGLAVTHGRVRMFGGSIVAAGGDGVTAGSVVIVGGIGASAETYGVAIFTAPAWRVTVGSTAAGSYTLSVTAGGTTQTTAPIAATASAATVQSAIAALSNVGAGNVYVWLLVGFPSAARVIVPALALGKVSITADFTGITGGSISLAARPCFDAYNAGVAGTVIAANCTGSGTGGTLNTSGNVALAGSGGGSGQGPGADHVTMAIAHGGTPIAQALVWITTDSAGNNTVAGSLPTDSNGHATFLLTAGDSYYLWARKDGWDGILGQHFVAVAD